MSGARNLNRFEFLATELWRIPFFWDVTNSLKSIFIHFSLLHTTAHKTHNSTQFSLISVCVKLLAFRLDAGVGVAWSFMVSVASSSCDVHNLHVFHCRSIFRRIYLYCQHPSFRYNEFSLHTNCNYKIHQVGLCKYVICCVAVRTINVSALGVAPQILSFGYWNSTESGSCYDTRSLCLEFSVWCLVSAAATVLL
jgi:hypothetical protein